MQYTKEQAKEEVRKLVERYKHFEKDGKIDEQTEEDTKNVFIIPLFRTLNWDVENPDEVSSERSKGFARKRPDYGFKINDIPKFFLEAKPLKDDLTLEDIEQSINYSWLKDVTWAVLTNFVELKVFNAKWKSKSIADKRFIELKYDEFVDRFDDLWMLSKDAFINRELDEKAIKYGKESRRTPVTPVIEQIFNDLMIWREKLTKDIEKWEANKEIFKNEELLDECVQRIIDRLIFIRVCEDRELEPPTLKARLNEWKSNRKGQTLIQVLKEIFREFDKYYDGTLFDEHVSEDLVISDIVISDTIHGLYQSSDRLFTYDFSAIAADVLGNIYEEYLGYVLKKGKGKVAANHSHRKEMGIFYTPTFVVDYIVKNTLGVLLNQLKQNEIDNIKILDPACGSGSFLIKAFDYLMKYHKVHSEQNIISFLRKTKILTDNIYGVDLDPKAAEIAQLNLLLRAVERRKLLPMMQNNIKVGNSLISDPKIAGDRAFDWDKEFKEANKAGRFDVIIGNPPYVRQEELLHLKSYLEFNYKVYHSMADLFVYFLEREIELLKEGGYLGIIVSNKWLKTGYGLKLREFLGKYWIEQFIDFGDNQVFKGATTYPCIIIMKKINKSNPKMKVCQIRTLDFVSLDSYVGQNQFSIDQKSLDSNGWNFGNNETSKILNKIKETSIPLKDYIGDNIYRGILTGLTEAFVIDDNKRKELIGQDHSSSEIIKPFLIGKEVQRYHIKSKGTYIILSKIGTDMKKYPAVLKWLEKFKPALEKRWDKGNFWFELRSCDYYHKFEEPKIIYGKITTHPRFTLDSRGYYANDANFIIPSSDKKLLGILNSRLGWFLISNICTQIRGGYQLIWKYFGNVSIAKDNSTNLEKLVDTMLLLNNKIESIGDKKTDEKRKLEEEVKHTDEEIDKEVYRLYGLTPDEITIVENSFKD